MAVPDSVSLSMFGATSTSTPSFGPSGLGIAGGGVTGMGVGSWPMGVFPGATTFDSGARTLDQIGQIHINYQRMTVKSDAIAHLAAGVARHHLFFVHRPRTSQLLMPQALQQYVACSLPDLNKLLFNDSCDQRAGGRSQYHGVEAGELPIYTASDIMRDWNLQGICVATEGVDVMDRVRMNKMMVTETVGGWAKCYNYWGTLETDATLYLLVKLVRIEMDSNGNTINGHYTDTSYEAVRRAENARNGGTRAIADPRVAPVVVPGASEYGVLAGPEARRRRVELGAVPAPAGDAWHAWQIMPVWYKSTKGDDTDGPSPDEVQGEIPAPFGASKTRWYGASIRVGRSGFVHHRGSSPELAAAQKEAAITLTHPFQRSSGLGAASTSVLDTAKATARTMDIDVYLRM